MSYQPPHLPPKTCNIKQHDRLQTLPWVLFFLGMSLLASVAMSIGLFAWYIPTYVSYQIPTRTLEYTGGKITSEEIDPLWIKEQEQKMVTLYVGDFDTPPQMLTSNDAIAEALLLSSDGWIAFVTDAPLTKSQSLIAVDSKGAIYAVSDITLDPYSQITYANIEGDGFRVMPFAAPTDNELTYMLAAGSWTPLLLEQQEWIQDTQAAQLDAPLMSWPVVGENGSVVFDSEGRCLGFVYQGQLLPSWLLQYGLPQVLSGEPVVYTELGVTGSVVSSFFDADQQLYRDHSAFVVDRVAPSIATESALILEDVITHCNNHVFEPALFAQELQESKIMSCLVLRKGEEIEVVLK